MKPLSTMNLDELIKYTDIPEYLIQQLEDLQQNLEDFEVNQQDKDFTIERLENENANYKNFVRSMYKAMNEQTRAKDLKQAINEELDFFQSSYKKACNNPSIVYNSRLNHDKPKTGKQK